MKKRLQIDLEISADEATDEELDDDWEEVKGDLHNHLFDDEVGIIDSFTISEL